MSELVTKVTVADIDSFNYVGVDFQTKLNCVLKTLFSCDKLGENAYFRREDGSKKGDYTVYSNISEVKDLEMVSKNLQVELNLIKSCVIDPFSRLTIGLNKTALYLSVIPQVLYLQDDYGMNNIGQNKDVFLMFHSVKPMSLIDLRTQLVIQHVALLLNFNGYKVHFPQNFSLCSSGSKTSIKFYKLNTEDDLNVTIQSQIQSASTSKWQVDLKNNNTIVLNCRQYLTECNKNCFKYLRNVEYLFVTTEGLTMNYMKESATISNIITKCAKNIDSVIHVVPENKACLIQKASLLVEMLDSSIPNQNYLINQGLFKNDNLVDTEKYIKEKRSEIQNALIHKYGVNIMNNDKWKLCTEILINTEVNFDFLCTKLTLPVKIDSHFIKGEISDKGGAFVQYNCARLSMLFKHFEEQVEKKYYKSLPAFENIDFNELKLPEEWNLFYNYVFPFPIIVREIVQNFSIKNCDIINIPTHTIAQMLIKLSRDLSIYYNKVRILVDPHLQNKMFARLYLLKCIHQIMKCGLALLNLSSVNFM